MGETFIYNNSLNTSFTIYDAFGDDYTFYINQNPTNSKITYFPINIRLPFYYSDNLSIGLSNIQRHFNTNIFYETGIDKESYFLANGGGIYINIRTTNRLWLNLVLGMVYYEIDAIADELNASWYGDPGLYWNGEFYEPGTPLKVKGKTDSLFSFSIGFKYHLTPGFYLEFTYYYFPGATIENMEYILEGPSDLKINVSADKLPKPITIIESSIITFGLGFGL
ncbi:MAG: hypothetical protein N2Z64_05140 [Dictyoglomus thermophilum]|nr:hypothetical protein [Dictyoglomus thermophilum]MCX7720651.1 hypothetical protein [Dictyoglomus thermophilum]